MCMHGSKICFDLNKLNLIFKIGPISSAELNRKLALLLSRTNNSLTLRGSFAPLRETPTICSALYRVSRNHKSFTLTALLTILNTKNHKGTIVFVLNPDPLGRAPRSGPHPVGEATFHSASPTGWGPSLLLSPANIRRRDIQEHADTHVQKACEKMQERCRKSSRYLEEGSTTTWCSWDLQRCPR